MNKRSAVLIASGLVLAMLVASVGIMLGFTGPTRAGGGSVHMRARDRKPVVKTVTDRHTVHVTAPVAAGSAPQAAPARHQQRHAATRHQQQTSGGSGGNDPAPTPSPKPKPSDDPDPSPTPAPQPSPTHTHEPEPGDD